MIDPIRISLANRPLVGVIALAVAVLGLIAAFAMPQAFFPEAEEPESVVMVTYPGASAEVMESEFVRPLENSLASLEGIQEVTSRSEDGTAQVTAAFIAGDDDGAEDEVQQTVAGLAPSFPDGADVQVQGNVSDDSLVMILAASADEDEASLVASLEEHVLPELESTPGVREVESYGYRERAVEIIPDEEEIEDLGLTPHDVSAAVASNDEVHGGGTFDDDSRALAANVGAGLDSLEAIEDLHLLPRDSDEPDGDVEPVALGDVAEVQWDHDQAYVHTRTNGQGSVSIIVYKAADAHTVGVSERIWADVPELEQALGDGGELTPVLEMAPFIQDSTSSLVEKALTGLLFMLGIVVLFLRSPGATVVPAVTIPLALLLTTTAMWASGYSLNVLTLAALTVAAGRVIDDSMVVVENIRRHQSYGGPRLEGIHRAVREVALPVATSTLAGAAVFLPLAFISGPTGEFFRPFAVTVSLALLASLALALTVVPVLAYWLMGRRPAADSDPEKARQAAEAKERRSWLQRGYIPLLRWVGSKGTRGWRTWHRWAVLGLGAVLLVATLAMASGLRTTFLEEEQQNQLQITQILPAGTALAETNESAQEVEEVLLDLPEVEDYTANVGSGESGLAPNAASYWITTADDVAAGDAREAVEQRMEELDGQGEISVTALVTDDAQQDTVEVELRSNDDEALRSASEDVVAALSDSEGLANVRSDLADEAPTLSGTPIQEEMAAREIVPEEVADATRIALEGALRQSALVANTEYPMRVTLDDPATTISDVEEHEMSTPHGSVELGEVAEFEEVERPQEIRRTNGTRTATVTGAVDGGDLAAANEEAERRLAEVDLPSAVTLHQGGAAEELDEATEQMGIAILVAVVLVFLIMVAQFRSLGQPFILLAAIPFAATGAVMALRLTGLPFSVTGMIGILMLVGLAAANSILLISLVNDHYRKGMPLATALVEGGRHRIRPVLMTAITTCCALLPMAMGLGTESVFLAQSLAVVVIGGLIGTTLLTLLVVPTLYVMLQEAKEARHYRRLARRQRRQAARSETPASVSDAPSQGHPPGDGA